jgi:hypothetical protein
MRNHSLGFALLSIFTTTERATEIEGDLIEQSRVLGQWWMRRQMVLVAFSLSARSMLRNPLSVSLLCLPTFAAIFLSLAVSEWVFRGPVGSILQQVVLPENGAKIAVMCLVIAPMAFFIGGVLVRIAPAHGAKVAVAVALLFALMVIVSAFFVRGSPPILFSLLKVGVSIGLVPVPLLWGSLSSQRRALGRTK